MDAEARRAGRSRGAGEPTEAERGFDESESGAMAEPAHLAALDRRQDSFAEDLIDGLLPGEFRWRRFVRNYPLPALAIAALGGYWLGRTRGRGIAAALSAAAADQVMRGVHGALGDESL